MNIPLIQESRWAAREKYAEYMRSVKERHTDEDAALMAAYKQLMRGKRRGNAKAKWTCELSCHRFPCHRF